MSRFRIQPIYIGLEIDARCTPARGQRIHPAIAIIHLYIGQN